MPCPDLPVTEQFSLLTGVDVQVTSSTPSQSRSESIVGVNPLNSQNLICASKKFIDPQKYHFTISTSFSMDGGQSWTESQPILPNGWDGMTDPDLTFDAFGHAYLIVEPLKFSTDVIGMGMAVYKSTNGGQTWAAPVMLHPDSTDDKQWIDSDTNPGSPYHGAIYAVWGANTPLRFSRSTDHGATWKGVGNSPSGTQVSNDSCFAPSLCIGPDGTIHVTWHLPGSGQIVYTRSTNGGQSFSPVTTIVSGISSLTSFLPNTHGWPHFPNATFRVMTLVTSCLAAGNRLVVAWSDYRQNVARIYYRVGAAGGTNWLGQNSGDPLLAGYGQGNLHHFHPQLATAGNQCVSCAFYEFGPKNGKYLIDVIAAKSCDDGGGFGSAVTITDNPWDPAVNAPWSHGDSSVTFIGEYFGYAPAYDWFATIWTDTRTGVQELFFDRVEVAAVRTPIHIPSEVLTILAGVVQDGGGIVFVGGHIVRIPPWDPGIDILHALVAMDSLRQMRFASADKAMSSLRQIIAVAAKQEQL
jgi:hypothetical protein